MSYCLKKQIVKIKTLKKHYMPFCNSRQMDITVVTADGKCIFVPWAKIPSFAISSSVSTKSTENFDWFWRNGYEGQKIYLYHGNDQNNNFLSIY